ncbi:ROK family protein [Candidatus Aerophobetes bacterium]|nr:ROK family protein [Candidatus Aerophobetes bacterium]
MPFQLALANLKIEFLAEITRSIESHAGYKRILNQLQKTIKEVIKKSKVDFQNIIGIATGVPGIVSYSTGEVIIRLP